MSKQESVTDWIDLARAYDKVEKETVQPYVIVSLEDQLTKEILYQYDLPRDMFWRYQWVVRWRMAKLQCNRPKHNISQILSFYDKTTGLQYGFGSLLSQLTSAKAQVTINNNKLQSYMASMVGDLFYCPDSDPIVTRLRCKISQYQSKINEIETAIKTKIADLKNV